MNGASITKIFLDLENDIAGFYNLEIKYGHASAFSLVDFCFHCSDDGLNQQFFAIQRSNVRYSASRLSIWWRSVQPYTMYKSIDLAEKFMWGDLSKTNSSSLKRGHPPQQSRLSQPFFLLKPVLECISFWRKGAEWLWVAVLTRYLHDVVL